MTKPPFKCEDIKAVRGHLDELTTRIKEAQENTTNIKKHLNDTMDKLHSTEQRLRDENARAITEEKLGYEKRLNEEKEKKENDRREWAARQSKKGNEEKDSNYWSTLNTLLVGLWH